MKLLIGFISFFCLNLSAHAAGDFSGHWAGTSGKATGPVSSDCSKLDIVITQTPTSLTIKSYDAECGLISSNWGPLTMNFKGSQVVDDDGNAVGTVSDTKLSADLAESGVQTIVYSYELALFVADGKPALMMSYGTKNNVAGIMITGTLQKL